MKSPIPDEVWNQHVAILAKTGKGKTVVAKGGAGAQMKQRRRCGVVDPTAAWWGMRLKADGKTPAFPMVIFGGDHGDIPLIPNIGRRIGVLVANSDWSWIIDISKFGADDRTEFMTGFAEALFAENRRRLNLFLDECHLYMPQQKLPTKASAHMTAACNNLVSGGRSRGLNITMISQRSAKVHKDSLTQAETLITLGMIAPQDIAAAEAWVKVQGDMKTAKAMLESLPGLPVGTGWVYAPEMAMLERVKFPMIDTFDSSRAPGVGEDLQTPTELGQIDLDEIKDQLTPKRVVPPKNVGRFDGPTMIPGPSRARPTEPAARPSGVPLAVAARQVAAARHAGFLEGREACEAEIRGAIALPTLGDILTNFRMALEPALRVAENNLLRKVHNLKAAPQPQGSPAKALVPPGATVAPQRPVRPHPPAAGPTDSGSDLGKGPMLILAALAQRVNGCTRTQVAVLTGYKATSRKVYLQQLKQAGLAVAVGDRFQATDAGIEALGDNYDPLPTGDALRQKVLAELPAGEKKILEVLIRFAGHEVERGQIRDETGYQSTSVKVYLQKLAARELVVVSRSGVKASADLFS